MSPRSLSGQDQTENCAYTPRPGLSRNPEGQGNPLFSCITQLQGRIQVHPHNPGGAELLSPVTLCPSYQMCTVRGRINFITSGSKSAFLLLSHSFAKPSREGRGLSCMARGSAHMRDSHGLGRWPFLYRVKEKVSNRHENGPD